VLRRGLAPTLLVIAVAVTIWLLSGVPATGIVEFLGYEVAFVALPGAILLWALRGRRPGLLVALALGWPLGSALEILAFSATAVVGARTLFLLYPVVVIGLSALVIRQRRRPDEQSRPLDPMSGRLLWTAAATLSLGLVYLALMFLPQVPLPSATGSVAYSPDFVYQMSKIAEVLYHWPPTNPGLSGVPLPYEWFVFFHMAAVSQVTHLSIPIIALRLDFVPTIVVIGCQLLFIGRAIAGAAWTGVVAMAVVFLLGPLDLTTDTRGAPAFYVIFSNQLWASWTFPFGAMFFLALLYLTVERLGATSIGRRFDPGFWVLVTILMIGASGAKASVLPVLLAGTALYVVIARVARFKVPPVALVMVALEAALFVVTFFIVYRGGAASTGISPLASLDRTFPVIDASNGGIPLALRVVLLPLAYVAGLAGMLLPVAGILYLLRRRHRDRLRSLLPCLCMLGAGIVIANVFHQVGYSEVYFQDTGYLAGCIVAAAGLRAAWMDAGSAISLSRRAATVAFAGWGATLIVAAVVTAITLRLIPSEVVMYSLIGAGCVGSVVVGRLVARRHGRPQSGLLALGLIPLAAAAALTSPIELAPTMGRVLSGTPITVTRADPANVRGLTPGLLAALDWLRDHSSIDTVIAVNNHWIDPDDEDGRYYYYSAVSERQVFIEGYDPVRYQISIALTTPEGADFATRKALNNAVFDDADANALTVMTQQYSVRYLFIDHEHQDGDVDPDVDALGTVVYASPAATIIAVG